MFNLQGSEIIVILLLALVVLGPEKLPDAIRRFSRTYAELKKMGSGFQTELKSALDEPMREMRETAEMVRDAADPDKIAAQAEAENAAGTPDEGEPPIVADPDEPTEGIADPGPTVADASPPEPDSTAPDDDEVAASDETEDAEVAANDEVTASDGVAANDETADDEVTASDVVTASDEDATGVDAAPARPVNRIAAGNSSESIAAASAAVAAAAESESSNGSEAAGPAFHSAAPRHGRTDRNGADGADGEDTADSAGDEPTEAAIDESSGEAATA